MIEWLTAETVEMYQPTGTVEDLVPAVRPQFDALLAQASAWGMKPHVRSAGRTCAQQAEQVKLGYSHADLCRGMHVMGHAIDLDLSPNTCATYTKLGQWWESQGGVWGGRWTQFGECGDAGHFHYGFGGAGAVPTSVCPSDVSLSQCAQIREDYLDAAFAEGQHSSRWGLVAGAIIIGAAVGLLVATLRVKPGAVAGVFENPIPQARDARITFEEDLPLGTVNAFAERLRSRAIEADVPRHVATVRSITVHTSPISVKVLVAKIMQVARESRLRVQVDVGVFENPIKTGGRRLEERSEYPHFKTEWMPSLDLPEGVPSHLRQPDTSREWRDLVRWLNDNAKKRGDNTRYRSVEEEW